MVWHQLSIKTSFFVVFEVAVLEGVEFIPSSLQRSSVVLSQAASTENKASAVLLWEQLFCVVCFLWPRSGEQGHSEVRKVVVTVVGKRDGGKSESLGLGNMALTVMSSFW